MHLSASSMCNFYITIMQIPASSVTSQRSHVLQTYSCRCCFCNLCLPELLLRYHRMHGAKSSLASHAVFDRYTPSLLPNAILLTAAITSLCGQVHKPLRSFRSRISLSELHRTVPLPVHNTGRSYSSFSMVKSIQVYHLLF